MSGGGNIKVAVRCRPFNSREIQRNAQCLVQMKGDQTVLCPPKSIDPKSKSAKAASEGAKNFAFDHSYWSFDKADSNYAGQDQVFEDLGKPLLENAFAGYNNCIFAYGQTGSGKSYSMMGYGEEIGIIPRICRDIFGRITTIEQDPDIQCTVEVSYLEIYNERCRDLLNPSSKGNLKVREHPSTGPYVEDLAKLVVRSFQEIDNLMDEGNKARTVAATNMNETSSRSHAVFTLILTQKRKDDATKMSGEKVAKISLVDLAGSERATSTGATGARLKEGAEINKSLSTLGRVIAALADLSQGKMVKGKKAANMVPYRDSILTWLLKDSLGGNSMTAMIAAISPADINFEETLGTLRYADSAKRIKNHAVVNEDPNARMIRELKEELSQLRSKLGGGGGGGGGGGEGGGVVADEVYPPDTPMEKQMVSITNTDGTVKKVSKAEIVEQLDQSEKLYKDLNRTWEEKVQKTEEVHKEREAALEELGVSIEKGFVGVSTPKKMPHLVNLSDDPLLAECLVYQLKPGNTTVGNDSSKDAEIRLNGSKVLPDHCTFENVEGTVTVIPKENAAVMVNGIRLDRPKRLRSGFRIILGDFHIFRFNNPQEARAEREEKGSLLRHSVTASQLNSPSPKTNGSHERSMSAISRADSEADTDSPRTVSPMPFKNSRESDWSLARREAVTAVLGPDQRIQNLPDEELDALFDDLQRVRDARRARPESRIFEVDEDLESVSSVPFREKYASNGTLDNFSLDTAITVPSTPQAGMEEDDRLRFVREEMQSHLDKQKEEYQAKLKVAEEGSGMDEVRAEKQQMEDNLREMKDEMQKQLEYQREEFEKQIQEQKQEFERQTGTPMVKRQANGSTGPSEHEIAVAKKVLRHWRQRKYVGMAETVLQNAALLKEAQVMSQTMDKNVVFQFCIVDEGHCFASSYDLVLNGIPFEDDEELDSAIKPCVGIRVVDFKTHVVHLWSLHKLRHRVRLMRQMQQYLSRPDYLQHFDLENPFSESCQPEFSRLGDADVPLVAVFESKVQDFNLDIISPYTSNVVGIVRLSLEPSSAEAPSSTLKFNVVMHDMIGFPEREGTEVHAQLFVPGISDEGGATTTQMIKDFDEGPVRFESVHSMGLPLDSPRDASLRVSIFSRVTDMHLDKLLSWDDMRDASIKPKQKRRNARIAESEFFSEEYHDIFARIQLHEISEDGTYKPTDVLQTGPQDPGAYQLHQGLQRRVVVNLTHSSGNMMRWEDITSIRVGRVHLLDASGTSQGVDNSQQEIPVHLISTPSVRNNADGTSNVTFVGQWDSSAHNSLLLDRTTSEKYRVQVTLSWTVGCEKLKAPMTFSHNLCLQIRSRSYIRQTSIFAQFLNPVRVIHSTVAIFSVILRPTSAKHATDLWRMSTQHDYVKGEEGLSGWIPRGVSLVRDFIGLRKRRRRIAEIETARSVLSARALTAPSSSVPPSRVASPLPINPYDYNPQQKDLLLRVLALWCTKHDTAELLLDPQNLEPPSAGAAFAPSPRGISPNPAANGNGHQHQQQKPSLVATVRSVTKNPNVMKGGFMFMPDPTHSKWIRRFVELRKPYLHIYSVTDGDELHAVNLSNARVDHQPQIARLLTSRRGSDGSDVGGINTGTVFAVWARENAWIFRTRTEAEKIEWILRIDQSYFSGTGSGVTSGDTSGSPSEVADE